MSVCARWTGVEAKAFREATRLKQEPFAEYVGVAYDTVKKWERRLGDIRLSSSYAARMDKKLAAADSAVVQRFWSILRMPTTVSGDVASQQVAPLEWDADDYVVVSARTLTGEVVLVSVPRRTFVRGIGAAASIGAFTPGKSLAGKALAGMFAKAQIDHVRHFEKLRMSLIESDNIYGSAQTLPHVLGAIDMLQQLKRAKVGEPQGILRMLAMFTETAAWQYQDQRDFVNAQHWASRALECSHRLGDDYYIGLSLVRMSQLACDQGDGEEAEELATAAQRSAPDNSLFGAAALTFRAHALALAGDRLASARAYDHARSVVARADADPKWGMFLDDSYIDAHQAHTFAEVGEYRRATAQFAEAMGRMQPGYPRDKGVYLARTAVAHMAAGDVEPAAALGQQALEIGIGTRSARILHKVGRLSGMIDPASTQTGVAEFCDAFATWEAQSCPDRT